MITEYELIKQVITADIAEIDFQMIKLKLQNQEEGVGWSVKECDNAEVEYVRFLALKRAYPDLDIVPNKVVDTFWHFHILDTRKYALDCQTIFGYFLHHYPYFGMNGEEDANDLLNAFEETKSLYNSHFASNYVGDAPKCKAPKCRTACKPMKCKG
jgi:hypothetical protein